MSRKDYRVKVRVNNNDILEATRSQKEVSAENIFAVMHPEAYGECSPEELFDKSKLNELIENFLKSESLEPMERAVIEKRFGFNGPTMTPKEIAAAYDISKEEIKKIQFKAIRKIWKLGREVALYEFNESFYE